MGGSSSNDVGGSDKSSQSGGSTNNNDKQSQADSFDRSMSNAERPDRAPADSSNTSNSTASDNGSRSPNDDGGGTSMNNDDRPDRAPADSSTSSNSTASDNGSRSPNDDGGGPSMNNDERPDRAPAQTTTSSNDTTPDTRSQSPNDDDRQQEERSFFDRAADVFSAPPTDASGNPRSTSPVADRINNTVNYSASEFFGSLTKSPRDAAIEMANAEFGVQAQVTRREINRDIDQKLAETDQQIANVDQRLADINQQLSPQMHNGIGGFGTIGFAPLDDARALMAEGRTLTEQKSALEAQRAGLEQARNLPDTMDMGFISRDVYEAQSKLTNSHINRLSDQDLAELGFEPSLLENKETGFRASVYRNSNTGETVLAFQGTNFDSVEDWKNNVAQGLGLTSPQYEQAKEVATEFQQAFAGENLALTGHSLGGGMAAYASLSTGIEATTFNAAGLNPRTLDRIGATREEALGLVSAHHVNGEALNWAQDSTAADLAAAGILGYGYARSSNFDPVPEALGTRFSYEAVSINGLPPDYQGNLLDDLGERVDLHLMESVLNTLQQERQRIFDETRLQ